MVCRAVQILTFTEHFVFRVAFVANNYEFDEDDHLDSSNYHYLISLYTGSMTVVVIHKYIRDVQVSHTTTPPQPFYGPFLRDHPGEPVPEENFWTLWCKGRLTEADMPTIRLGATPSGLKGKGKGFPYSIPSVGPGADPGVQAVSLQVTVSHPPGGRLPLLSARPAVTTPAAEHHCPLAGTKLYCLVTEAHRCKQLA